MAIAGDNGNGTHEPTAPTQGAHGRGPGPTPIVGRVGMYYRAGSWFGAPHHPTVLTLRNGNLSAVTADGAVLFDAPVEQFTARFTLWSTIVLTHRASLYCFVTGGYAGKSARPFTAAQVRDITDAGGSEPDDGSAALAAAELGRGGRSGNHSTRGGGGMVGVGARTVGVAFMFQEQFSDFSYSLSWAEALEAAGVPTTYRTKKYSDSVWAAAGIVITALVVVAGGLPLLVWLLS